MGMHKPESILENDTHKLLLDFIIQMHPLTSARRLDLEIVKKKKKKKKEKIICRSVDFPFRLTTRWHWRKRKKRDKYLDLAREFKKKTSEHEIGGDINCNWWERYSHQGIGKGAEILGNKRISGNHPDYSIIKIGQNTEKSPGNLRRLAVTKTSVENH